LRPSRSASRRVVAAWVALSIVPALPISLVAQSTERQIAGPLYDELARMDSLLFHTAFVSCNPDSFQAFFTEDVEFYHDRAGASFGEDVRTLRGCPRDQGVRRVLIEGSLEVYPMNGYGAIQMGEHRFVEAGAETSTIAKFVHLWRHEDGRWRIARVLSFEHKSETR
jgi:hypothetical protein